MNWGTYEKSNQEINDYTGRSADKDLEEQINWRKFRSAGKQIKSLIIDSRDQTPDQLINFWINGSKVIRDIKITSTDQKLYK